MAIQCLRNDGINEEKTRNIKVREQTNGSSTLKIKCSHTEALSKEMSKGLIVSPYDSSEVLYERQ